MLANIIWYSAHGFYYGYIHAKRLLACTILGGIFVLSLMGARSIWLNEPVKKDHWERTPYGSVQMYHGHPYIRVKGGWMRIKY